MCLYEKRVAEMLIDAEYTKLVMVNGREQILGCDVTRCFLAVTGPRLFCTRTTETPQRAKIHTKRRIERQRLAGFYSHDYL